MLRYLSLDIICSSKLTVFLELRSRKTVRFSEQITSADKYLSIFSRQMEAIVYIIYSLFFIGSISDYFPFEALHRNNFMQEKRFCVNFLSSSLIKMPHFHDCSCEGNRQILVFMSGLYFNFLRHHKQNHSRQVMSFLPVYFQLSSW